MKNETSNTKHETQNTKHEPRNPILKVVCSVSMGTSWYTFTNSNRTAFYLLYTSLCTGGLNAIRKQHALSAVLSTEGRVVGLCWAKLKPEGPQGPKP